MIGLSLRCLPLLHEHSQRDELLDILVDAGESAWDRGAHEVFKLSSWLDRFSLKFAS